MTPNKMLLMSSFLLSLSLDYQVKISQHLQTVFLQPLQINKLQQLLIFQYSLQAVIQKILQDLLKLNRQLKILFLLKISLNSCLIQPSMNVKCSKLPNTST